jgi:hypothetical protein
MSQEIDSIIELGQVHHGGKREFFFSVQTLVGQISLEDPVYS